MSQEKPEPPVNILLVEDNPGDVTFFRETLRDVLLPTALQVVEKGDEVLAYLRKEGKYAHAATPDIIFLDFYLPVQDGSEVLAEIRQNLAFQPLPVWVFALSEGQSVRTLLEQRGLQVSGYVLKPVRVEQLTEILRTFPRSRGSAETGAA